MSFGKPKVDLYSIEYKLGDIERSIDATREEICARLDQIIELLRVRGVRGADGEHMALPGVGQADKPKPSAGGDRGGSGGPNREAFLKAAREEFDHTMAVAKKKDEEFWAKIRSNAEATPDGPGSCDSCKAETHDLEGGWCLDCRKLQDEDLHEERARCLSPKCEECLRFCHWCGAKFELGERYDDHKHKETK